MAIATISPKALDELWKRGEPIELIDVRTPVEFREVHVEFARNVPLDALDPGRLAADRDRTKDAPLYVICRSGGRAAKACEKLSAGGFSKLINVEGGTLACVQAGLPVVHGKKAMSLERQVRLVAGAMVLVGSLLALYSPWFLVVPAFVGAGLMYSAITDSCPMGMLLARMPWNQVANPQGSCTSG